MVVTISSDFTGDKVFMILNFPHKCITFLQLEEAEKALDKLDVDKDGKVSYPEFLLVMKYKK